MIFEDVDIRKRCWEILDEIGHEEIARYCYENDLMSTEDVIKIIGNEEKMKKHKDYCYISVKTDDVLNEIDDDDLYDWLNDNGYDSPKNQQEDFEFDKYTWLKGIRDVFSKMFTKIYTKEDFKKEICDAIDCYL